MTTDPPRPLTPDEARWVARLRRVLRDAPPGIGLFVDGQMHVLRLDPSGKLPRANDGRRSCVDPEAVLACVGHYPPMDGGGW